MTSFPVFVPMFWSGGGGGGGPLKPKDLLIVVGLLGAVYGGLKYTFDYPRFKMRMSRGYRIRNDEIYVDNQLRSEVDGTSLAKSVLCSNCSHPWIKRVRPHCFNCFSIGSDDAHM